MLPAIAVTKFIHVLLGVTALGALVVFYFYIISAIRHNEVISLRQTIQLSLYLDGVLFFIFGVLFFTGTLLVHQNHFSFSTAWIQSAYFLLWLTVLSWVGSSIIRFSNYRCLRSGNDTVFKYKKLFHTLNGLILLFIIMIIHDAVTHRNFLS